MTKWHLEPVTDIGRDAFNLMTNVGCSVFGRNFFRVVYDKGFTTALGCFVPKMTVGGIVDDTVELDKENTPFIAHDCVVVDGSVVSGSDIKKRSIVYGATIRDGSSVTSSHVTYAEVVSSHLKDTTVGGKVTLLDCEVCESTVLVSGVNSYCAGLTLYNSVISTKNNLNVDGDKKSKVLVEQSGIMADTATFTSPVVVEFSNLEVSGGLNLSDGAFVKGSTIDCDSLVMFGNSTIYDSEMRLRKLRVSGGAFFVSCTGMTGYTSCGRDFISIASTEVVSPMVYLNCSFSNEGIAQLTPEEGQNVVVNRRPLRWDELSPTDVETLSEVMSCRFNHFHQQD